MGYQKPVAKWRPARCQAARLSGHASGALSAAEVTQNIGRLSATIPVELWSELKREKLLDPGAPTPN